MDEHGDPPATHLRSVRGTYGLPHHALEMGTTYITTDIGQRYNSIDVRTMTYPC